MKKIIIFGILTLLMIAGCTQTDTQKEAEEIEPEPSVIESNKENQKEPEDNLAEEETETQKEDIKTFEEDDPIKVLIDKGMNVKSLSYKYKGPKTKEYYYEFFVMGNNIKYIPDDRKKILDEEDSYNVIVIDTEKKTAFPWCDDRSCKFPGQKDELDYQDAYFLTPFDWAKSINYAEKIGEELIEKRKAIKIQTDTGVLVWIDSFYGVPLQVVENNEKHEYTQITFNDLTKEDVVAQS